MRARRIDISSPTHGYHRLDVGRCRRLSCGFLASSGREQAGSITSGAVGNGTVVLAVTGGRQVALETSGGHI